VNVNKIRAQWYFNLSGTYNIRDNGKTRLQLFAVVNNLFDHNPPVGAGDGRRHQRPVLRHHRPHLSGWPALQVLSRVG
jgi:outer membrane receptor protein involved in Fe transport